MDASIIIPTHNRKSWVLRAVAALVKQTHPADLYEIIVSCDRCTDGTADSLRSAFGPRVQVTDAVVPGLSGALNTGLRCAVGELAIVLDDEMEAEEGLVTAHIQAHRAEPGSKIAVTGYSAVTVSSLSTPYARMVANDYECYFADLGKSPRKSSPRDLCGSNFSIPTSAFRAIGGYNEISMRRDFELGIRLLSAGYQIRYCRAACAKQQLAVEADTIIHRASDRARKDYQFACEYPWCVPDLPFYQALTNSRGRFRWRLLWQTAWLAIPLLKSLRRLFPGNLHLGNLEYAARYCEGLRQASGSWRRLIQVCRSSGG